jgi:hypothetical protein
MLIDKMDSAFGVALIYYYTEFNYHSRCINVRMQSYSYCHEFDFSFHQNKSIILMYILNLNNTLSEIAGAKAFHLSKSDEIRLSVLEGFVILSNAFDHLLKTGCHLIF